MIKTVEVTSFAFRSTGNNSRFGAPRWNSLVDLTRNETRQGRWHAWAAYEKVVRAKRKGPLSVSGPSSGKLFALTTTLIRSARICPKLPRLQPKLKKGSESKSLFTPKREELERASPRPVRA